MIFREYNIEYQYHQNAYNSLYEEIIDMQFDKLQKIIKLQ
jgi:hypothetical protein